MSELSVTPPAPSADKMQWAESVLGDILRLMDLPAKLELKDAAPSPLDKGGAPGISVAVHLEGEASAAGAGASGKRSGLSDALQFLANKIINRAGTEKRWILVGIGGHPEPRPAPQQGQPQANAPAPKRGGGTAAPPAAGAAGAAGNPGAPAASSGVAPGAAPTGRGAAGGAPAGGQAKAQGSERPARPPRASGVDEATLSVPPDETLAALGQTLAQKAAQHGRFYGVVGLSVEDRARLLQAARSVEGVTAKVEGEGKARRLVLVPDKPVPMPKRAFPDFDDEDEAED